MSEFSGKVVLVTGGRSGIGRAIANRFHQDGARVFTAQRSAAEGFETIEADLSDPEAPVHVIETLLAQAGRLDVLVNNAGVMHEALLHTETLAGWDYALRSASPRRCCSSNTALMRCEKARVLS